MCFLFFNDDIFRVPSAGHVRGTRKQSDGWQGRGEINHKSSREQHVCTRRNRICTRYTDGRVHNIFELFSNSERTGEDEKKAIDLKT